MQVTLTASLLISCPWTNRAMAFTPSMPMVVRMAKMKPGQGKVSFHMGIITIKKKEPAKLAARKRKERP